MKSRRLLASIALILAAMIAEIPSVSFAAVRGLPPDHEVAAHFQPLVDNGTYVGIIVGIVGPHGRRVFSFGNVRRNQNLQPSGETAFALASVTKTFTGVLLADLVLKGVVKLDDPITKYLPPEVLGPNSPLRRVTLLDLATHMSGLPKNPSIQAEARDRSRSRPLTVKQMHDFLSRYRPTRAPGVEFRYSNVGISLLGHILERASGKSYEWLLQERICSPLGMKSTRVSLTPSMRRRLAQGYNQQLEPVTPKSFDVGRSSGGLYSTVDDMMDYLAANMGLVDAPIVPALVKAQQPFRKVPGKEGAFMGLAWHVKKVGNREIISKNGGLAGFQSFIAFSRSERTGIVALANTSPKPRKLDAAARQTLSMLFRK